MADISITASVGDHPAPNRAPDVKVVQTLLNKVSPSLSVRVGETGTMDRNTLHAIREFQLRFMSRPDSRVDPGGRTIFHLNEGFVSKYVHCNAIQRKTLDRDLISARTWLDRVNSRLASLDADAKTKIKNIFHVDADGATDAGRLMLLRVSFIRLRLSLDENFPLECEAQRSLFGAYVVDGDRTGTIHFPINHFSAPSMDRIMRLIHERSHTIFQIHHAGMQGVGSVDFGQAADDDNGFTYDQAVANAYCYGWLSISLQPDYHPSRGEEITVTPRRR